jgi:hypothetical protein
VRQSYRVKATGIINFTHDGAKVGSTSIWCKGTTSTYTVECTVAPNDIEFEIYIDWSGACGNIDHKETWTGSGLWPGTYSVKHSHSPEEWTVSIEPMVGGFLIPVDKLGLLVPYLGVASTVVATVVTTAYIKRRK